MSKKRDDDENEGFLKNFYYNNKLLIWILIIIVVFLLLMKYVGGNDSKVIPSKDEVKITIEPKNSVSVGIGNTINLKANINVLDAIVFWTSSDSNIAKVNNGNVEGISLGQTRIIATYIDKDGNEYSDFCEVEVIEGDINVPLNDISFPEGDLYMPVNGKYDLKLILSPSNALISEKKFASSDDSIVSITQDGKVEAKKSGHARLVATVNEKHQTAIDVYVEKEYKTSEIVVSPSSISFNADVKRIKVGETDKLYYSVIPNNSDRSKLTWYTDEPSIVTVDQNGNIKGKNSGETFITVSSLNGKKASIIVEVYSDIVPIEEIIIAPLEMNLEVGKSIVISPTIKPSNSNTQLLNYYSLDTSIVTVSVNGLGDMATLQALKKGSTTVVISSGNVEKRIKVNVKGENSEPSEDDTAVNYVSIKSDKNNLAKTYEEAEKIPVPGASIVTLGLSSGVSKIKYCFSKIINPACTPNIEKQGNTTILIPSGDIYAIRIIKYDFNGKELSSTGTNYIDGVLNYYINTKSPSETRLYSVTGAYDNASDATLSPSKLGSKISINVNDNNRYLKICLANSSTCVPSTRINNYYSVSIDKVGTTRIYIDEYDSNNQKIGNREVYYVYVKEEEKENLNDNTGNIEISTLRIKEDTSVGKYLSAKVDSDISFGTVRFCYTTVLREENGTCNLDLKSNTVSLHDGTTYFHPKEKDKTYYGTFTSVKSKEFLFDVDELDKIFKNNILNKDVIFEFSIKTTKGFTKAIPIRISLIDIIDDNSYWKASFIR